MTLLALVSLGVPVAHRLISALSQRPTLWARTELTRAAAQLPPGVEVTERGVDGAMWHVPPTLVADGTRR
ncbi:hypothetical protein ACFFX1_10815 [Dactylosporangium sucinum]|nr:hypothetical protein [Dactylosporangium sucinum]